MKLYIEKAHAQSHWRCYQCSKDIAVNETVIADERRIFCLKCGKSYVDVCIAKAQFEVSELQNFQRSLPQTKKNKPDADINIGQHL